MLEALLAELSAWAAYEPAVCGLALVGSQARGEAGPDSDVDVLVLCRQREPYLDASGWLTRLGTVLSVRRERWGHVETLRVWLAPGIELELGFADPAWARLPLDPGTRRVLGDGHRILYDPEGVLARAAAALG